MKSKWIALVLFLVILCFMPQSKIMSMEDSKNIKELEEAFKHTGADYQTSTIQIVFDAPISKEEVNRMISIIKDDIAGAKVILNTNVLKDIISFELSIDSIEDLTDITNKLKGILHTNHIKNQMITMIYGEYQEQMTSQDIKELSKDILIYLHAKKIEGGFLTHNLLSISGFTPFFEDSIITGGHEMNINIVLKTNKTEGKTFLVLGTPIIYADY
ncbi:MAG: YwmB family TATA-box binding protein [Eubacteriales bacterium]